MLVSVHAGSVRSAWRVPRAHSDGVSGEAAAQEPENEQPHYAPRMSFSQTPACKEGACRKVGTGPSATRGSRRHPADDQLGIELGRKIIEAGRRENRVTFARPRTGLVW